MTHFSGLCDLRFPRTYVAGSACTSAAVEPSYVLRAIGLSDELANGAIRIGLGRFTTEAEVEFAADALIAAVGRQRAEAAA